MWADTGYGDMQDGGKVAAGQGMYFHVAMMNGQANQLSEMVPSQIIQSEIGRYINAGATSYFLVNTSDIRPVAMTTRAVMEMAWGGVPATTGGASGDAPTPRITGSGRRKSSARNPPMRSPKFIASILPRPRRARHRFWPAANDIGRKCSATPAALQQHSTG